MYLPCDCTPDVTPALSDVSPIVGESSFSITSWCSWCSPGGTLAITSVCDEFGEQPAPFPLAPSDQNNYILKLNV
jgi:hypothetical protein